AGALDAVAHPRPAAAVMLAQFAQQAGAILLRQRPDIGAAHRGGRDWYSRTDVELDAERQPVTALAEIDHAVTVAPAHRHRAAGLAHHLFAIGFGQMPNAEIGQRGIPQGHGWWGELILFEPWDGCKITQLGQGVGQPGNGWFWQIGTG